MPYIEYTAMISNRLRQLGYKWLEQGIALKPVEVGYPEGSGFGHFELIPHREEPVNARVYDAIDSPEGAAMAGGIDLVFYWLKPTYNDVLQNLDTQSGAN